MQIIDRIENRHLPTEADHLYFVECWYAMVHRNSLDSHRVRSMDTIAILEEIAELLERRDTDSFAHVEKDLKRCAMEAGQFIERDPVVKQFFGESLGRLTPHLQEFASKNDVARLSHRVTVPLVRDCLQELCVGNRYREHVIELLRTALFPVGNPVDRSTVYRLTGMLLTRMANEGFLLEELYSIARRTLFRSDNRPFKDVFEEAVQVFRHPVTTFTIVFRLDGIDPRYDTFLGNPLAGVCFARNFGDLPTPTVNVNRFREIFQPKATSPDALLARIEVCAVSDRSSALKARDDLSAALDLLRFEVMPESIRVHDYFLSFKTGIAGAQIFQYPQSIPNPRHAEDQPAFEKFVKATSDIYGRNDIDDDLKNRLRAGFRQYRLGRDTTQLPTKFLNWWTAVENLLKAGVGKMTILDAVQERLIPCLVLTYLSKLLNDYRETFQVLRTPLPLAAAALYPDLTFVSELADVHLLDLLRNATALEELRTSIRDYPYFSQQISYFAARTKDATAIRDFLKAHKDRLDWHLHRLYRMRNAIVHTASAPPGIVLLSANLEFYLKSILTTILDQVQMTPSIRTLGELFDRMEDMEQQMMALLATHRPRNAANTEPEVILRRVLAGKLT